MVDLTNLICCGDWNSLDNMRDSFIIVTEY